jgi:hypothetical protein
MLKFNKLKTTNVIEYIFAILLVYGNGSWLMFEAKTVLTVAMVIAIALYLLLRKVWYNELQSPNFAVIFLALFPFISIILNLDREVNLVSVLFVSISYVLLSCFSKQTLDSILHKYAQFIYVLMLISIVFGTITLINYSFLTIVPVSSDELFGSNSTMGYYNFLVYTDRVANDFRTQSIFWEPGAWAVNEIFAFYWFIFVRKDYKKLPYFVLGLVLTLSTTGLMLGVILLFAALKDVNSGAIRRRIFLMISVGVFLIVGAAVYVTAKTDLDVVNLIYEQTVEKFTSDSKSVSFNERVATTKQAYEIALENPFFGIGKATDENKVFVTSGLAETVYQLGFLYLFIYLLFFRVLFSRLGLLLSFLVAIIMMNAEAYSFSILSTLILIYGAKNMRYNNLFSMRIGPKPVIPNF